MTNYLCEKGYSCCNFKYYNSEKDISQDCEHLIEVDSVVHGKWIYENKPIHCSECGFTPTYSLNYDNALYCPHCGAKMK